MTDARPTFRKPWTHGAKAYIEADTFAALAEGMKRMRKVQTVLMPNTGEAGDKPCAACGVSLKAASPNGSLDKNSYWTYSPKRRAAYGMHYECSWGAILQQVLDLGRLVRF